MEETQRLQRDWRFVQAMRDGTKHVEVAERSDVIILAGQSNFVGRGDPTLLPAQFVESCGGGAENDGGSYDGALLMHDSIAPGGFAASSDGWTSMRPQEADGFGAFFGPELSLAAALGRRSPPDAPRVCIAKFGMGSTAIGNEWALDGEHFARFVAFCRRVLAEAPQPARLGGLCWLQGESDSSSAAGARAYEARLVALVSRLRAELAAPALPIVASEVVWAGKHVAAVNGGIRGATSQLAPSEWCSAAGLTTGDDAHLDSSSLLVVGERFAAALHTLCGAPAAAPADDDALALAERPWALGRSARSTTGTFADWPLWSAAHPQRSRDAPAGRSGRRRGAPVTAR
jgi:hypothetical protein